MMNNAENRFAWKWIEPVQQAATKEPPRKGFADNTPTAEISERLHPAQYVRKEFDCAGTPAKIKSACVYATAHGLYRLYINGKVADGRLFPPEVTPFDKLLTYQKYDITGHLCEGKNAVGAIITDGWHIGRIGLTGDSCQYADKLAFIAQLEIIYENGDKQIVHTDSTWKSSTGALDYSDIFIGERYDARKEPSGWNKAGFDDSKWTAVTEMTSPETLEEQTIEPVLKHERFTGKLIITPSGQRVYDMGQVIAGVERLTARGKAGAEIRLEHGEVLDRDGNFRRNIVGRNKEQTDYYIFAGSGTEVYEPIGTWHGFRYVMAVCDESEVEVESIEAFAIRTQLSETAHFECSDERLNKLWHNILWSQRGNMISIPTDCPQRERSGFTGDMQIFIRAACWNMDMRDFVRSWLRSVRLEQKPSGEVTIIAPNFPGLENMQMGISGTNSSSGWGDAIVIVPWELYSFYGDISLLEENYDAMRKWVEYERKCAESGIPDGMDSSDSERMERNKYLWNTGFHFGDWLVPSLDRQSPFMAAKDTAGIFGTAYFANSCRLLSEIASLLGKPEDNRRYAELYGKICGAFTAEYYLGNGRLDCKYQGAYVVALAFGLLPESERADAAETLNRMIAENGYRLDTGFLSVSHLMDVLCDNGYTDTAYRLLFQEEAPSWLYEVGMGATTMWERWNAVLPDGTTTDSSYNHYSFGCVADWMMRHIAGIREVRPGFDEIIIEPHFDCGLDSVSAWYDSVKGRIAVNWQKTSDGIELEVTVPEGVSARFVAEDKTESLKSGTMRIIV